MQILPVEMYASMVGHLMVKTKHERFLKTVLNGNKIT